MGREGGEESRRDLLDPNHSDIAGCRMKFCKFFTWAKCLRMDGNWCMGREALV